MSKPPASSEVSGQSKNSRRHSGSRGRKQAGRIFCFYSDPKLSFYSDPNLSKLLKQQWANGPKTFLGLQAEGFTNLFTLVGPHNAATFCNIPRCIEVNVEFVTALIKHMRERGYTRCGPSEEAVEAWTQHVLEGSKKLLLTKVRSWFMGMNTNIEGKHEPKFLLYAGGLPQYRARCAEVAQHDYEGMLMS